MLQRLHDTTVFEADFSGVHCRGSTGYGEDGIQSLPGNIGTNDVADCMKALDAAITEGKLMPSITTTHIPHKICSPCLSLLLYFALQRVPLIL